VSVLNATERAVISTVREINGEAASSQRIKRNQFSRGKESIKSKQNTMPNGTMGQRKGVMKLRGAFAYNPHGRADNQKRQQGADVEQSIRMRNGRGARS
jgi:hypothetical protein